MATVAEYVVEQLVAWGVQRVYGVVGDTLLPLLDALDRRGHPRFVPARHETAAGLMASAEAKLTGRPGVCLATSGPGVANLLNGLGDAYADGVPVLALTGQVATREMGTGVKQDIDQQTLVRPVATYTAVLAHPEAAGLVLPLALRMALGRRSVAHVSVPKDVWAMSCTAPVAGEEPFLTTPPAPAPEVVQGAVGLMAQAVRPLILVGAGARAAGPQVLALAERWGAGILQSLVAKGAIPWSHPLVLGSIGEGGTTAAHAALQEADLLLAVACNWWPQAFVPTRLPVIKVDCQPAHIGGRMAVRYGLAGAAEVVIPQLTASLSQQPREEWRRRLAELRQAWEEQVNQETEPSPEPPLSPGCVMRALELVLPPDAIVALDTGDHTVWFNRLFGGERHEVLVSGNWRTIGFGLPAALAAKLARPERAVVAVVGDTGLQSLLGELVTAAELQLPVIIVVMNNGMMAIEHHKAVAKGYRPLGTQPRNPDFAAVAQACGLTAYRPQSARELAEALQAGLAAAEPVLLDVPVSAPVAPTAHTP